MLPKLIAADKGLIDPYPHMAAPQILKILEHRFRDLRPDAKDPVTQLSGALAGGRGSFKISFRESGIEVARHPRGFIPRAHVLSLALDSASSRPLFGEVIQVRYVIVDMYGKYKSVVFDDLTLSPMWRLPWNIQGREIMSPASPGHVNVGYEFAKGNRMDVNLSLLVLLETAAVSPRPQLLEDVTEVLRLRYWCLHRKFGFNPAGHFSGGVARVFSLVFQAVADRFGATTHKA